jgi:hypothetical protein
MPSSGHRRVLKAASTRSGRAIHTMSTARRGKTPGEDRKQQPISPSRRAAAGHPDICAEKVLAPLDGVDPPTV